MPICHRALLMGSRPHCAIWGLTERLERTVKHKHTPRTKTKAKRASTEGTASSWKYLSCTHQPQSPLANTSNVSRGRSEAGNESKAQAPRPLCLPDSNLRPCGTKKPNEFQNICARIRAVLCRVAGRVRGVVARHKIHSWDKNNALSGR